MTKGWNLHQNRRGFTIVELLIVVVVIAILAAITIVSYTGITQRAKTSRSISTADQVRTKAGPIEAKLSSSSVAMGATIDVVRANNGDYGILRTLLGRRTLLGCKHLYWNYSTNAGVNIVAGNCPKYIFLCYCEHMELLDIVNVNDEIIGVADRDAAHKKGMLHRIATVFVFNKRGDLYIQVHKKSGGLYDHSVGGHISSGETYAQGAAREAKEELGLSITLKEVSIFYPHDMRDPMHTFGLYECTVGDEWEFVPNDEVEELIPMDINAIQKMMVNEPGKFTRGFIATMNEYVRVVRKNV